MATLHTQARYSREEFARRGDEIYESTALPRIKEEEDRGKFVVIDIETRDFEVDRDELVAIDRLRARNPGAQLWLRRVGFLYAHRFGGHRREIRQQAQ